MKLHVLNTEMSLKMKMNKHDYFLPVKIIIYTVIVLILVQNISRFFLSLHAVVQIPSECRWHRSSLQVSIPLAGWQPGIEARFPVLWTLLYWIKTLETLCSS